MPIWSVVYSAISPLMFSSGLDHKLYHCILGQHHHLVSREFVMILLMRAMRQTVSSLIIYKEMFLGCDWLIRVQLIPNITQNSAKICNTVQKSVTTVQKSVTTVQKSVTTVQKSVTTVQKSVISSLSDGIYSLKNQKYGGRIFTFA